jgi:hypothetical protein
LLVPVLMLELALLLAAALRPPQVVSKWSLHSHD